MTRIAPPAPTPSPRRDRPGALAVLAVVLLLPLAVGAPPVAAAERPPAGASTSSVPGSPPPPACTRLAAELTAAAAELPPAPAVRDLEKLLETVQRSSALSPCLEQRMATRGTGEPFPAS